jgi:hypothetical protein
MTGKFVPWKYRSVENAERGRAMNREFMKKYYVANKEKIIAHVDVRRRHLNVAAISGMFMPQVEEFYKEARRLTEETGVLHVVDHYWPINGKGSCGLHVPWNLRVITGSDNDSKGNKEPEDHWSLVLEELKENRNA